MLQNVHDLLVTLPTPTLMIFIGVTNSYSSLPQPTALERLSDQPATILTEFCDCQFTKMQDSMIGNAKLNNLSFFSVTQASEVVVAGSTQDSDLQD